MELYTKRTCTHTLEMTDRELDNLRVIINYAIDEVSRVYEIDNKYIDIATKLDEQLRLAQNRK